MSRMNNKIGIAIPAAGGIAGFCRQTVLGACEFRTIWRASSVAAALFAMTFGLARSASAQIESAQIGNGQALLAQNESEQAPSGFFEIVFAGGWVGILIIGVLLALSMTAAYLIIDHLLTVRRKDLIPEGMAEEVGQLLQSGKVVEAKQICADKPSVLSFIMLHGISELEFGWSAVEKSLEDSLAEQSARLFRKIEYLAVIGNIAPMVGLLGTVIGMILAFQEVAVNQGAASAPQLAKGIYQALVTTVGGLIVAIPSLGAFAIFRNRVDQLVAEAGYIAQHVFGPLRRKSKARKSEG